MALSEWRFRLRALLIEALVIMASILAAFSLDRWWDARQDRVEERLVLQALHDEFEQAMAELQQRLGLHQRIEGSIRSTLTALKQAHDAGVPLVTIPDTALAWAYVPPTTQLALGTLNGMLASGRLGVLRDRQLRIVLSSLENVLGELTEEETRALAHVHDHLDPVLRRRLDVSPFVNNALIVSLLDGNVTAPGVRSETRVPADLEVIAVFAVRLAIIQHCIDEFPPVQDTVEAILRLIEASLVSSSGRTGSRAMDSAASSARRRLP